MIPLTKKEQKMHKNPLYLFSAICARKDLVLMITKKKYFKVKDHCHYIGKYRGAAHDI